MRPAPPSSATYLLTLSISLPPPHPYPTNMTHRPLRHTVAHSSTGTRLFEPMMHRYLASSQVRDWLFTREPHPLQHSATLSTAFSYACMYYPPTFVPATEGDAYPLPKPFLDLGDFIVCQRLHDGIALGTLFNPNETHALAPVRDSMMSTTPKLSCCPRARNFAVDLRVKHLEIVEFAWMDDDSLIVACRRLHMSPQIPDKPLVLSADLLFYPVLPSNLDHINDPPLLRMTLAEHPAMCHFCGSMGVEVCRCPPSCKVRLQTAAEKPHHSRFPSAFAPFDSSPADCDDPAVKLSLSNCHLQQQDPRVLQNALQCWPSYAERIFRVNQVGTFFCNWFQRSPCGTTMVPSYAHRHPIPYQFITGTRTDTLLLTSMYVKKLRLHERTIRSEMRLTIPGASPCSSDVTNDGHTNCASRYSDHTLPHIEPEASISLDSFPTTAGVTCSIQLSSGAFSVRDDVSRNRSRFGSGSGQNERTNSNSDGDTTAVAVVASVGNDEQESQADDDTLNGSVRNGGVVGQVERERLKKFMNQNVVDSRRCVPCAKLFSKRSNLVRHIVTKHFEIKPYQCEACRRRFGHRNHLRRHEEKLHGAVQEAR